MGTSFYQLEKRYFAFFIRDAFITWLIGCSSWTWRCTKNLWVSNAFKYFTSDIRTNVNKHKIMSYLQKRFNHFIKDSSDPSHFIFEINVGNRRIRHRTILKLNFSSDSNWQKIKSFKFRVVQCRIRLFPALISKIKWLSSELPLIKIVLVMIRVDSNILALRMSPAVNGRGLFDIERVFSVSKSRFRYWEVQCQ